MSTTTSLLKYLFKTVVCVQFLWTIELTGIELVPLKSEERMKEVNEKRAFILHEKPNHLETISRIDFFFFSPIRISQNEPRVTRLMLNFYGNWPTTNPAHTFYEKTFYTNYSIFPIFRICLPWLIVKYDQPFVRSHSSAHTHAAKFITPTSL